MPNRLIKSSIHESEKVNQMTDFQFRVWVSLITYVDDYGRGDARPAIIKGNCFPLRERITSKDIGAALAGLAGIGCISLYEVDGRSYLYFPNWEKHQTIRNKQSKFPAPPEGESNPKASENICIQLLANVPVIQSESESESKTESETRPRVSGSAKFEIFWQSYPKKVGKGAAEKIFERIRPNDDLFTTMLNAVSKAKNSAQWQKEGGQYIPNPATWLNQRRWEDEPPDPARAMAESYQRRDYEKADFEAMYTDVTAEIAAQKAAR